MYVYYYDYPKFVVLLLCCYYYYLIIIIIISVVKYYYFILCTYAVRSLLHSRITTHV